MIKNILAAAALTLAMVSAASATPALADRHAAKGLECASCHKTTPMPSGSTRSALFRMSRKTGSFSQARMNSGLGVTT